MEDYKSNSDKARQEQQSEKKVEAVITGAAKTRKKGEMQKFADVFIAEDANNVKSYILLRFMQWVFFIKRYWRNMWTGFHL